MLYNLHVAYLFFILIPAVILPPLLRVFSLKILLYFCLYFRFFSAFCESSSASPIIWSCLLNIVVQIKILSAFL